MNDRGIARMLDYFRKVATAGADNAPDGDLVRQYVDAKSESAFESLVRRHGPMVYGVARRVLRDGHAAEDAFQATFLALARKAPSLRNHAAIGGWLYRVALRAALRAKPQAAVAVTRSGSADPAVDAQWSELRVVLDEEIDKLPDRCRLAVIACYLNGRTADDAAKEFGCPRGTVLSRLAAAREKLRRGLTRRGFTVSIAGLTTGLTGEAATAAMPSSMIALAAKVALPGAILAPTVLTLTQGVLHAMWITKVKVAVITLAAVGVLGVGAGQYFGPGAAVAVPMQTPNQVGQDGKPIAIGKNELVRGNPFEELVRDVEFLKADTPERKLMKDRCDSARRELWLRYDEFNVGRGSLDSLISAGIRVRDSALEIAATREGRIKILEAHLALTKSQVELDMARFQAGAIKEQEYQMSLYCRLDAEIRLMREKEGKPLATGSR